MTQQNEQPLSGVRVIGLEQYMSGPYCTMLLADAGAEVIKIERPGVGDPRRVIGPFVEKGAIKKAAGYLSYNRNKKSLALNLTKPEGQKILRELTKKSDVIVENLRPGVMDKMGMDYNSLKTINPGLVYAMISGFGRLPGYQTEYSNRPAFDIVAEAMGGVMNLVGFADKPPTFTLYGMADVYSGLVGAYGIMQALFMKGRTGQGQLVDVSMLDNMLALNERMVTLFSATGEEPERGKLKVLWPRGAYKCRDGYVALNVPDEIMWERLAKTMERPDLIDDPRSATGTARAENADFLEPILVEWMSDKSREEVVNSLNAAGMPAASVYNAADVFKDEHFRKRNMLLDVEDPEIGTQTFARTTPHLSASPVIPVSPAPNLGQHTRLVLKSVLAYTDDDVDSLKEQGVVSEPALESLTS